MILSLVAIFLNENSQNYSFYLRSVVLNHFNMYLQQVVYISKHLQLHLVNSKVLKKKSCNIALRLLTNMVTHVRLPLFLEHWKIVVWKVNCLPLNNCFSYRNILQNGVNYLSTMVLNKFIFLPYDLVQTSPGFGSNMYQIMYGET